MILPLISPSPLCLHGYSPLFNWLLIIVDCCVFLLLLCENRAHEDILLSLLHHPLHNDNYDNNNGNDLVGTAFNDNINDNNENDNELVGSSCGTNVPTIALLPQSVHDY